MPTDLNDNSNNDEGLLVDDGLIVFNGINGVTGEPITTSLGELAALVRDESKDQSEEKQAEQRLLEQKQTSGDAHFGLQFGVDDTDLKQTGWGVVFHLNEDPAVVAALAPLIKHRREQIGDSKKAILLQTNYNPGESYREWLKRHGVMPVNVKPNKVPFYLLLVGSPEKIPYSFGYQLDLDYAVGRIHFETVAEYERYVQSVIEYETGDAVPNSKEAVFFGTKHALDRATNLSANCLIKPLTDGIPKDGTAPVVSDFDFRQRKFVGADAKKSALAEVFNPKAGDRPPAFLFTATHGLEWPMDDPRQRAEQGALICQDWSFRKPVSSEFYFAAADVNPEASVHGLITFNFACFGGGTPTHDRFANRQGQTAGQIARQSFLAALPQALLSHPKGGALACIGHVERAWGCSILIDGVDTIQPFQNAISRILAGQPVGLALKDFNEKYANVSVELTGLLDDIKLGAEVSDADLAGRWTERNDAESYVVIGDPAVRLRVDDLK